MIKTTEPLQAQKGTILHVKISVKHFELVVQMCNVHGKYTCPFPNSPSTRDVKLQQINLILLVAVPELHCDIYNATLLLASTIYRMKMVFGYCPH